MPAAIGLVLFTIGAPLAVVNFVAIGLGATLINAAVGVGLSLGASLLLRPGATARMKPSDGQQTIRQARPPRWKHYGQVRIIGPVFWWKSENIEGQFYIGLCLNEGRIDSFTSYHIDDVTVLIDSSGVVTTAPYSTITTKILTRLGLPTETAYSEIQSAFGYADVRGDGVATVLGIFDNFATAEDQAENYPNRLPKLRVTIKASVVWDPRDTTQVRTDKTTWQWSENAVICYLDYYLSADGFGVPWERFENNIAEWIVAADICDEQVWSLEDSRLESRYRIAATYLFTDLPGDIARRFEQTFDGRTWQKRDGSIGIAVGTSITPDVTLDDNAIRLFQMERGEDRLTAVAGVRAQYMSPASDYREVDADPWPDGETVLALSDDRPVNLDLTWVPSHGQARRLMERVYNRARAKWSGQIITSLAGLKAIDERFIRLEIDELGIAEAFEVDHYSINLERMEVIIDVTSAAEIVDAVRPEGLSGDMVYRGSGQDASGASSPILNFNAIVSGVAPEVGDLVIMLVSSRNNSGWVNPTGWTIVDNTVDATPNIRCVSMFKEITAADLAVPPSPLSSTEDTVWQWAAFQPPDTGLPSSDLLATFGPTNSNPTAIAVAAAAISGVHILVSGHSARNFEEEIFSASWTGATPDEELELESNERIAQKMIYKLYSPGPGSNITADMNDWRDDNYQRAFVIKYT